MKVCIEDDCPMEGLALPNWMDVCPVCKNYTYDLEGIERAMNEPGIPIEMVDRKDLNYMLELLRSNQEDWDYQEWDFVVEMHEKYGENHDS